MSAANWAYVLNDVAHFGEFTLNCLHCHTNGFGDCGKRNCIIRFYQIDNVFTPIIDVIFGDIFMDIFMDISYDIFGIIFPEHLYFQPDKVQHKFLLCHSIRHRAV